MRVEHPVSDSVCLAVIIISSLLWRPSTGLWNMSVGNSSFTHKRISEVRHSCQVNTSKNARSSQWCSGGWGQGSVQFLYSSLGKHIFMVLALYIATLKQGLSLKQKYKCNSNGFLQSLTKKGISKLVSLNCLQVFRECPHLVSQKVWDPSWLWSG